MEFRIADTFTDSLARLTGEEQKAVKTAASDLQVNPANPSMSFHKLAKPKDKNFWSVRVGSDIRLIVHKSEASLLLCCVDHLDKAYDWAERRKLEALLELATGGKPRVPAQPAATASPFDPPDCAAPLPRDDQRGGVATSPRLPLGEMDRVPAPGATAMGGAGLHLPCARLAQRVDVHSIDAIRLYKTHIGPATIASREIVRGLGQEAATAVGGHKY